MEALGEECRLSRLPEASRNQALQQRQVRGPVAHRCPVFCQVWTFGRWDKCGEWTDLSSYLNFPLYKSLIIPIIQVFV